MATSRPTVIKLVRTEGTSRSVGGMPSTGVWDDKSDQLITGFTSMRLRTLIKRYPRARTTRLIAGGLRQRLI